jgi:hypothetical protein
MYLGGLSIERKSLESKPKDHTLIINAKGPFNHILFFLLVVCILHLQLVNLGNNVCTNIKPIGTVSGWNARRCMQIVWHMML